MFVVAKLVLWTFPQDWTAVVDILFCSAWGEKAMCSSVGIMHWTNSHDNHRKHVNSYTFAIGLRVYPPILSRQLLILICMLNLKNQS